ncbi:DUF2637 domain-containing protein [Pseudonocardia broussonetiae]|uniref:DUF2637 domain-containing protein n=1 Tax=Pseudonocardia broussonetiae TaxID=2736640 RepID=A0A6M6JTI7_9PSEU|nr:DUF2637 domain-containing protein [Pseudonocardia broussonetiae]QJY51178.1 DUF2637 domain-containing protein [Pseudonocardia broussonetiae]
MNARAVLSGLLLVVAAAAAILSFAALRDLALLCGFSPQLAWLLPVVVDAGAAAGSLVWLGGWAAEPARRFARALALALLGSSVAANALGHGLAAFALAPPWWVVVIVSAVAPSVLGAVVHLAVLVGRTDEHHTVHHHDVEQPDIDEPDVDEQVTGAVGAVSERLELAARAYNDGLLDERGLSRRWAAVDADAATSPHPVDPVDADGRVVELVELLEAGAPVTGAHAAVLFGCSPRTGRWLLTRAQALAVTPAAAAAGTEPELVGAGWPR